MSEMLKLSRMSKITKITKNMWKTYEELRKNFKKMSKKC